MFLIAVSVLALGGCGDADVKGAKNDRAILIAQHGSV
jgi:hypothetical protein